MNILKHQINPGEEIIASLTTFLKKNSIKEAAIVSIIGAIDECTISTMPKDDAKQDIVIEYHEPLEMSGTGEVVDGKPHIHAVLGREGNKALFGHLHSAKVTTWFVHIYLSPLK